MVQPVTRFNLETESGEIVPFASARDLFAFVERRMEQAEQEDDDDDR